MRTTAADFALFKSQCEKCIKRWRIVGWRVEYNHEEVNPRGRAAEFRVNVLNRSAVIVLFKDWQGDKPTRRSLVDTARHECTHLLLSPLADIVSSRYLTEDEEKHANESTVRHLQELLP